MTLISHSGTLILPMKQREVKLMKQTVPAEFLSYIKFLLSKSQISTRELNKQIGKSSAYISKLLSGQIGSIEYNTAYKILKNLAPDMSEIDMLLIDHFNIKPDSLIQSEIEQENLEYERRLQTIIEGQEMVDEISNTLMEGLIKGVDVDKIEFIKVLSELDLHPSSSYRKLIQGILYLNEHPKAYRLTEIFVAQLLEFTGEILGEYINTSENEKNIKIKIQEFIKEELNEPSSTNDKTS